MVTFFIHKQGRKSKGNTFSLVRGDSLGKVQKIQIAKVLYTERVSVQLGSNSFVIAIAGLL